MQQGTKILVEGRIEVRQWQDKDGNNRYTTEVIAENIEFAESKKGKEKEYANVPEGTNVVDSAPGDDLPF